MPAPPIVHRVDTHRQYRLQFRRPARTVPVFVIVRADGVVHDDEVASPSALRKERPNRRSEIKVPKLFAEPPGSNSAVNVA